ncbi:hypothetical protein [Nitrosovibrio sp. Nv4]|uniref:hypothetical protein n=1 Tax=Nitrosovibrio sp. Nv4 TaxID=1945880 RepID=UPI00117D7BB4|nr:hypothetical protein [Nitrosovibrio sp. Nv4]
MPQSISNGLFSHITGDRQPTQAAQPQTVSAVEGLTPEPPGEERRGKASTILAGFLGDTLNSSRRFLGR